MLSLSLKDIYLQKRSFWFALGYSLFVLIAFQNEVFAESSYIMGAMATAYMLVVGACAYEEKNNSEVILNSLPLKRSDIVLARYLSSFVFAFLAFVIIGVLGAVMKGAGLPIPLRYVRISDIITVVISLAFLCSLYFPVFFRYGYIKSRFFNLILFLLVFFIPSLARPYLSGEKDMAMLNEVLDRVTAAPDWSIVLSMVAFVLAIMYISMRLSVAVYKKREF